MMAVAIDKSMIVVDIDPKLAYKNSWLSKELNNI
mgnify:CR=1 FL=1